MNACHQAQSSLVPWLPGRFIKILTSLRHVILLEAPLGTALLALVQIPSKDTLRRAHAGDDTGTDADGLPVQLALLVQTPALVAQVRTQADNSSKVGNDKTSGAAVGQARKLLDQPVVGFPGLGGSGVTLSLLLAGLLLSLDASRLGLGLDGLVEELRVDGVHGRQVNVDEGSGGGGLSGDDLGRLRSSGLDEGLAGDHFWEGFWSWTHLLRGLLGSAGSNIGVRHWKGGVSGCSRMRGCNYDVGTY